MLGNSLQRPHTRPTGPIGVENGLRSAGEDRWRAASKAGSTGAGKGVSIEDLPTVDAELVEQESQPAERCVAGSSTRCPSVDGRWSSDAARALAPRQGWTLDPLSKTVWATVQLPAGILLQRPLSFGRIVVAACCGRGGAA